MPPYVQAMNVFYADQLTNAVVLEEGLEPWVALYDALDEVGRYDLDQMITLNGGLPFADPEAVTRNHRCLNGQTWYDTYLFITHYVRQPLSTIGGQVSISRVIINGVAISGTFTTVFVNGDVTYSQTTDTLDVLAGSLAPSTYVVGGYVTSGYVV